MRGRLYGIGVGPGDPELITLKALNCIKKSDIIILPAEPKEECYAFQIVKAIYPEIHEKEIVCLPFLMIKDKEQLAASHNQIYKSIQTFLEKGKTIAFLTIGDPTVYSTYSYIHKRELSKSGNAFIISGVPSFCAAAASLGISLADHKEQLHIIPGSYNIEETAHLSGTRIYMKAGKKLNKLKLFLQQLPDIANFVVYSISNCGMQNEKRAVGLENLNEKSGYLTIVIVKEKNM